ncbi:energy transducer TonB [Akkermansiaceae bacterium]|nr:energy transducer TonB [Akkermansiaceae bacterium]
MDRHVYRPPRGKFTGIFAVIGGFVATIAVFVAIPLSQKLSQFLDRDQGEPPEIVVEPPEEMDFETEEPPEEIEEEPEPDEMVEEANDLDLGIDLGDLTAGSGGGFVMDIPNFSMKGGDDAFGGDLDAPPQPVSKIPPTYPSSLLSQGKGGRVLVSCTIDAAGKVIATSIKQSSGHPDLDKAAINAVNRWKFKPGTRGGNKVKSVALVPFNFEVKKG